MLRARLILGTVFVAALVGLCWLDYHATRPGIYLLLPAIVLSLLCAGELLAMWRRRTGEMQPLPWVVYGGTLITVLAAGAPVWMPANWIGGSPVGSLGWLAIGLVVSLLLAMIGEMPRFDGSGKATNSLAFASLATLYVGGLMGFIIQLRLIGIDLPTGNVRYGMLALVSMITIVKFSDIGQYTAGRLLGNHKLAPSISPGKTWEGVLGGVLFAILGGFITMWLSRVTGVATHLNAGFTLLLLYPISIAAFGILGDLAESMLKRDAGVKDSSTWLAGFGGVLDLLDSLLGAAPVAYLYWVLVLGGP